MGEPRAYTEDEVIDILMRNVKGLVRYWAKLPNQSIEEKCDGVAFSILSMLDGSGMELPAFDLVLCPHEDDMEYHKEEGCNWFEPDMVISTTLHERYAMMKE